MNSINLPTISLSFNEAQLLRNYFMGDVWSGNTKLIDNIFNKIDEFVLSEIDKEENLYLSGASVALGLIGMGQAISDKRRWENQRNVWKIGEECGTHCLPCLERIVEGFSGMCKAHREGAAILGGFIGMGVGIKQMLDKNEV